MMVAASQGGCAKALFTDKVPNTPYDRYDAARNRDAEPYYFDEFGVRKTNLRARLLDRE